MKGGFAGPLCWYKAFMQKLTPKDDAGEYTILKRRYKKFLTLPFPWKEVPKDNYIIKKPVFFAACSKDAACVASENADIIRALCPSATIVDFDTDHWVLEAAPRKVNDEVAKWLDSLKL